MGIVDRIAAIVGMSPSGGIPDVNQDSMLYDRTEEYQLRINRYRHNWAVYKGYTAAALVSEDGARPTHVNYVRRNLDKINYFAFGQNYTLSHSRFQSRLLAADEQWGANKFEKMLRLGQYGSVTGDVMVLVAPAKIADTLVHFNDRASTFEAEISAEIKILVINPAYCTPIYSDFDMNELVAMHIKIPHREYSKGGFTTRYQNLYIDTKVVKQWTDGSTGRTEGEVEEQDNPIGKVYCVHIRNYPDGDNLFGADDVADVEKLNTEVTDAITSIGQTIKYHGDPITCIFGAKASNLKKGPNKIWGNLPKEGRVENLQLHGDLAAANKHLGELKEDLHAIMGVPEIAQGTKQAISNTSAVALHTMYLPLLERAEVKQSMYRPGLLHILVLALRWMDQLGISYTRESDGTKKKDGRKTSLSEDDYNDILTNTTMEWKPPLPKDKLLETNIQIQRKAAHLQSDRGALVELGEKDPDKVMREIEGDVKKSIERAQLMAPPMAPNNPNNPNQPPNPKTAGASGEEPGNGQNTGNSEEQKGRPRAS